MFWSLYQSEVAATDTRPTSPRRRHPRPLKSLVKGGVHAGGKGCTVTQFSNVSLKVVCNSHSSFKVKLWLRISTAEEVVLILGLTFLYVYICLNVYAFFFFLEYMYVNRCIYLPPKKSARSCPPQQKNVCTQTYRRGDRVGS